MSRRHLIFYVRTLLILYICLKGLNQNSDDDGYTFDTEGESFPGLS